MDKEQKTIERLKLAAEMSETYYGKPLIVTTSGGKDSDVCIALALAAGINFEVQHNHMCGTRSGGWKPKESNAR